MKPSMKSKVTRVLASLRRSQRGQTLLEFALVTPFVIFFLIAIVDGSIALDRRLALQHAVREGSRVGAVVTDTNEIKERTVAQAQDLIDTDAVDVCYLDSDENGNVGNVGDSVRVTVTFTYDFAISGPVAGGLFGGTVPSVDMTPSGTARLEKTVPGATACT